MYRIILSLSLSLLFNAIATPVAAGPLEELASSAGKDPDKLVKLGDLYVEAMKLKKAKATYKKALLAARQQNLAEVKFGLARIDIAKGKFRTAKRTCRLIEHKQKKPAVSAVCSGWLWLSQDRSARAMDDFNKAIALKDLARGHTGVGEAYRRRTEYQEAEKAYRAALDGGAGHVAWLGLAMALESNNDKAGALKALKAAVEAEPASCLAHYHYGRLLKNGDEAIAHLDTAIAIRPDWAEAYVALGNAHLSGGKGEEASTAFQRAVKAEPTHGIAHWGLGRALHQLGRRDEAKVALGKAIELAPDLTEGYLLLAKIQQASGDFDGTLETLEKARAVAGQKVEVYLVSGLVYFSLGRHTSARSHLNKAISLKPKLSKAYAILGDIACERRLYDAGRGYYDSALKGDLVDVNKNDIIRRKAECKPKR